MPGCEGFPWGGNEMRGSVRWSAPGLAVVGSLSIGVPFVGSLFGMLMEWRGACGARPASILALFSSSSLSRQDVECSARAFVTTTHSQSRCALPAHHPPLHHPPGDASISALVYHAFRRGALRAFMAACAHWVGDDTEPCTHVGAVTPCLFSADYPFYMLSHESAAQRASPLWCVLVHLGIISLCRYCSTAVRVWNNLSMRYLGILYAVGVGSLCSVHGCHHLPLVYYWTSLCRWRLQVVSAVPG